MSARPLQGSHPRRRGAALLLSVLVLFVVITIVVQISIGTITDARVARNTVGLTTMEQAIESVLLQLHEDLLADMEADGVGDMPDLGDQAGGLPDAGGGPGGGSQPAAVDSRMDEWAIPARTEINDIELRILIQDEDSKYNVLNMLHPDEPSADEARDRVARIIHLARQGTDWSIGPSEAEQIARSMQEHMRLRTRARIPKPEQLSDDPEERDRGLPLTLREFASIEDLHPWLFHEFRDQRDNVVHSLNAFLTVHTSVRLGLPGAGGAGLPGPGEPGEVDGEEDSGAPRPPAGGGAEGAPSGPAGAAGEPDFSGGGANGWGVNVNTAPAAVLRGLFDDRDIPRRFWDEVIEYRNLEKERPEGEREEERSLLVDEYGDELIERQIFESLQDLAKVRGWDDLMPEQQQRVLELLTTRSHVFSIHVTARRSTAAQEGMGLWSAEERRAEEESGVHLSRTVRSVVWRTRVQGDPRVVPLVRWEVLDHVPFEVVDDERQRR